MTALLTRTKALRRISALDTVRAVGGVLVPLVARGVILRRPRVVALEQAVDADRRAVGLLRRLRTRYGSAPLRLRLPLRSLALVHSADDAQRVLTGTPEPFHAANREKISALAHFQPTGVLISTGTARTDRRRFNEAVLQTDRPVHELADRIASIVDEEMAALPSGGRKLGWSDFAAAWWPLVRRLVLGDPARADDTLTNLLRRLRADANWSYAKPRRTALLDEYRRRLTPYLEAAHDGSLAAIAARTPTTADTCPADQVSHWLFAFDAVGMASWRALALLASHPAALDEARACVADRRGDANLPYLRACLHESVRLWPTTPAILRDTTAPTDWDGGTLPAGTGLMIYTPVLHRDPTEVPYAERFAPEAWLGEPAHAAQSWSVLPFSAGPAVCPGRNLVLLTGSQLLASLLDRHEFRLLAPARLLRPNRPLPGTLSPFRILFTATPRR